MYIYIYYIYNIYIIIYIYIYTTTNLILACCTCLRIVGYCRSPKSWPLKAKKKSTATANLKIAQAYHLKPYPKTLPVCRKDWEVAQPIIGWKKSIPHHWGLCIEFDSDFGNELIWESLLVAWVSAPPRCFLDCDYGLFKFQFSSCCTPANPFSNPQISHRTPRMFEVAQFSIGWKYYPTTKKGP